MMTASTSSILILNVSKDIALGHTRGLLLRSAGYIVESINSIEEALSRFRDGDFDLVVLCHSIKREERHFFIRNIRSFGSTTPVVFVSCASETDLDELADLSICGEPGDLLLGIEKFLRNDHSVQKIRKHVDVPDPIPIRRFGD